MINTTAIDHLPDVVLPTRATVVKSAIEDHERFMAEALTAKDYSEAHRHRVTLQRLNFELNNPVKIAA